MNETIIDVVSFLSIKKEESPTASMNASGVGYNFFVDLRKGKKPSIEKIVKLADYFDVSTDYILGRTSDPTKKEPTQEGLTPMRREVIRKITSLIIELPEDKLDVAFAGFQGIADAAM